MRNLKRALSCAMAGALAFGAMATAALALRDVERAPKKNADGNYNILFITTDQEHYFEEYPEGTSYLARQLLEELGTTFEKHYVCSNMSTSSRSVIYTGTHIADTHMYDNTDFNWQKKLDENTTTVADRMKDAGYYTALTGKWHMGDGSILSDAAETVTDLKGYGFEYWDRQSDCIGSVNEGYNVDPEIESNSVKWLSESGTALNSEGRSFFLAVNFINPHDIMNYNADGTFSSGLMRTSAAPDDAIYETAYDWPVSPSWNQNLADGSLPSAIDRYNVGWMAQLGKVDTLQGWQDYQNYYLNCIQDQDNHLLSLITAVDELGMLDNTIIVFTSDHGEMHGSHGIKGKGGFMYENNLHVPLIIVHPEYEGGGRVSAVTSHIDLAKTFVWMTGLNLSEKTRISGTLAGENLMELVAGNRQNVREGSLFCFEMLSMAALKMDALAQGKFDFDFDARGFVRGIVTDRYKFARYFSLLGYNTPTTIEALYANNDVVLYDLESDPGETVNLAADPEANAEIIIEMNAALNRLIAKEIGVDNGSRMGVIVATMKKALAAQAQ